MSKPVERVTCHGWWSGPPSVVLLAAVTALAWILAARARGAPISAETALPFGPFLADGLWVVWLHGSLAVIGP